MVTANSKGKVSRSKVENEQYIRLSQAWGPRTHVLDKHFLGLSCAGRPRVVTGQGYALCLCPGFPGTADLENVSRHGGLAAPGAHHTPAADEASSRELPVDAELLYEKPMAETEGRASTRKHVL